MALIHHGQNSMLIFHMMSEHNAYTPINAKINVISFVISLLIYIFFLQYQLPFHYKNPLVYYQQYNHLNPHRLGRLVHLDHWNHNRFCYIGIYTNIHLKSLNHCHRLSITIGYHHKDIVNLLI
jgi:hypothetical protein